MPERSDGNTIDPGLLTCAKCGGIATLPRPEKQYEGKDPVEKLLFDISKNVQGLTLETAVLTMMIRIEKALTDKMSGEKGKK
jgi:hypothetical protein